MKKRGLILLVIIAILWWWHLFRNRKFSKKENFKVQQNIPQTPNMKKIEKQEKEMDQQIIKKAEESFQTEFGRKPKNLSELVEKGFLSRDFLKNLNR